MIREPARSSIGKPGFEEFARKMQTIANRETMAAHQEGSSVNGAPENSQRARESK